MIITPMGWVVIKSILDFAATIALITALYPHDLAGALAWPVLVIWLAIQAGARTERRVLEALR